MYIYLHTRGELPARQFRPLLRLCSCNIFQALIKSLSMDELLIFNQLMIVEHWGGGGGDTISDSCTCYATAF